jgi:hypothetical protein
MDEVTKRRLERNEAVFRTVNEEIDDRVEMPSTLEYVCECADARCSVTVRMTHEAYRAVRDGGPNRYFVVPGHERDDLEQVVERNAEYLVVEKS